MANCYFCAAYVRNGEGYRRKVLVSESARLYTRGGGSYGQAYSLRTLCQGCAAELDKRNKSFAWRFPVSALIAFISMIIAVRNRDSLEGLAFLFFFAGGPGFVAFMLLGFLESQNQQTENPTEESDDEPAYMQATQNHRQEETDKITDSIINSAKEIEQYGICFYNCHGLDRNPENFEILIKTVTSEISPSLFKSLDEWEAAVRVTTVQKYLNKFQEATNPLRLDKLLKIFPQAPDEPLEDYTNRCMRVTETLISVVNQEEST